MICNKNLRKEERKIILQIKSSLQVFWRSSVHLHSCTSLNTQMHHKVIQSMLLLCPIQILNQIKWIILIFDPLMQFWGDPSNPDDGEQGKWAAGRRRAHHRRNYKEDAVAPPNISHDSWRDPRHTWRVPQMWNGRLRIKTVWWRESLQGRCQVLRIWTSLSKGSMFLREQEDSTLLP